MPEYAFVQLTSPVDDSQDKRTVHIAYGNITKDEYNDLEVRVSNDDTTQHTICDLANYGESFELVKPETVRPTDLCPNCLLSALNELDAKADEVDTMIEDRLIEYDNNRRS